MDDEGVNLLHKRERASPAPRYLPSFQVKRTLPSVRLSVEVIEQIERCLCTKVAESLDISLDEAEKRLQVIVDYASDSERFPSITVAPPTCLSENIESVSIQLETPWQEETSPMISVRMVFGKTRQLSVMVIAVTAKNAEKISLEIESKIISLLSPYKLLWNLPKPTVVGWMLIAIAATWYFEVIWLSVVLGVALIAYSENERKTLTQLPEYTRFNKT